MAYRRVIDCTTHPSLPRSGHGYLTIELTDDAIKTLQLDPTKYSGKNTSILYWQAREAAGGGRRS